MILLDSHVYFWWTTDDARLSRGARHVIEDAGADVYVSAVVAWEITNKVRSGKWPAAEILIERFFEVLRQYDFMPLPVTLEHAHLAGSLAGRHRDPFDRMLAAQSQIENVPLVTADPVFRAFGTRVLW
jgi:PIN domain nuclease of toxin-antitoxin system